MHQAGARAAALAVARIRRGRPWARAWRRIDYLTAITSQCTLDGPMAAAMAERARLEAVHGCVELAFCFGFPYCDFDGCGPAVAAFAADQASAEAAAEALVAWMAAHEADFAGTVLPVAEGVAQALATPGLVVLADTQDNPGGGGHGDTTGLLAELMRQGARDAVFGSLNDPASAAACHAAGVGARLALSLGGASDGAPLAVVAEVLALSDGRFTCTGPVAGGNPADLGPTALVRVAPGVRVILASAKMQGLDRALFTHIGVDPAAQRIVALKSSVHFRADFGPIAARVIVVAAPGPVVADPSLLPFRHLRPGLRLKPA
jgi:microcystin degradation protein MlrC